MPTQNSDEWKEQFLYDAKFIVNHEKILDFFVVNLGHTSIKYIPVSSWTMEKEEKKNFPVYVNCCYGS